jgi:hypothetical protein
MEIMNETPQRFCVRCHHRLADGVCFWKKRIVGDSETCIAFTPRQGDNADTSPPATEPAVKPLPPALPVKPVLDLPAETVAVAVTEQPRVVRHRQRFNLKGFIRDLLHINRIGTLNLANNFPHPKGRGETNTNTNERNTP